MTHWTRTCAALISASALAVALAGCAPRKDATLLNVSYDPTHRFYADYNKSFVTYWKGKSGQSLTIKLSNGGSGKQARAVREGLSADVVTLGTSSDIDALAKAGLVHPDWRTRLPDYASPYTSTVVFLVRKGNPKGIKDWPDLIKPGVAVITPNPKSSSGGRWIYLAAWGQALQKPGGSEATARAYVTQLYKNVAILDPGARASTVTFTQRGQGDVLLAWENEARLTAEVTNRGEYEVVYPPTSILAEPPVAVVDKNVDAHNTRAAAEAYLKYLYTPQGQEIAAAHFYRPRLADVAKKHAGEFPAITLFTADKVFGGVAAAQKTHFADGGVFDQINVKQ